ncbi:MAG: hypothetical protein ACOX7R_10705 [Acetivibrionales bacterium]|jgi:hypothetical protein
MAVNKYGSENSFETQIREYLFQGRQKLCTDLAGTREAIKLIAVEKTRDFMQAMDKGLDKAERKYLRDLIIVSMYQSFCYGYGIGRIEGSTNSKVFL